MKINRNSAVGTLAVILCGLIVVALLFPFAAFPATGSSYTEELDGFAFVFDGGVVGVLFGLVPVLMLAFAYLSRLDAYQPYVNAGLSALGILLLFLVSGQYGAGAVHRFGFWIVLVLYLLQIALSGVLFFGRKEKKPAKEGTAAAMEREQSAYVMEQLNKLFEMKEKGILTEEEFAAKKAEYLKKM